MKKIKITLDRTKRIILTTTIFILAAQAVVAAPLIVLQINKSGYEKDPSNSNAYGMKYEADYNIVSGSGDFNMINKITLPTETKSIKFLNTKNNINNPIIGFNDNIKPEAFTDMKYIEFGDGFGGDRLNDFETKGFIFDKGHFANKNIDTVVFRDQRPNWRDPHIEHSLSFNNYLLKTSNDGCLEGIKTIFFDLDIKRINWIDTSTTQKNPVKVFVDQTKLPKQIFVRRGTGTIAEWKDKLGVTDDSLIKMVW